MAKKAVSLTLGESNLLWLQSLTARGGARSLSDAVDRLITQARATDATGGIAAKSVVGSIDINESDAGLDEADAAIRKLFTGSLARSLVGRDRPVAKISRRKPTRRG
jgi:hypothetical protein